MSTLVWLLGLLPSWRSSVARGWSMRLTLATVGLVVVPLALAAQERWTPARLEAGAVPPTPVLAVAGGEVFLELTVTTTGSVGRVDALRTTPPFTDAVFNTVRGWRFRPAERTRPKPGSGVSGATEMITEPVESRVFMAAIYRPPALHTPTLGEPPQNVAPPSDEVAFPRTTTTPVFPPLAQFDGTVLIEVAVDTTGRVTDATVLQSAAGFDQVALDAARRWTFQPGRVEGSAEETYAYLVMAFRQPVTGALPGAPPPRPPSNTPGSR